MQKTLIGLLLLVAAGAAIWLLFFDASRSAPSISESGEAPAPDAPAPAPALRGRAPGTNGPQAAVEGRYIIRGLVVDGDSKPLPAVPVELTRSVHRWPGSGYQSTLRFNRVRIRARAQALLAGRNEQVTSVATLVSDSEGRFVFRLSQPGSHQLYARPELPAAGGHASAYLIDKMKESVDVTLKVLEGAPLPGRVEDASGQAVAARVWATSEDWRGEIACDAAGTFNFPAVPHGDMKLSLTLPGGRQFGGFSASVPTKQPVVLRVPAGTSTLSGTVSAPSGEVVADAFVTLRLEIPGGEDPKHKPTIELAAQTRADGRYAFAGLPGGVVTRLQAVARGFLAESRYRGRGGWTPVPLAAGQHETLDIVLRRGSTIHGRVVSQDDDRPVEGASVTLYFRGWHPPPTQVCLTDAEGLYRFEGLDQGKFLLLATHPAYFTPEMEAAFAGGHATGTREAPAQLAVRLPKEDTEVERNLGLGKGRRIEGQVLDPAGRPVAGAGIHVKEHGLEGAGRHWGLPMSAAPSPVTTSDGEGRFTVDGLAGRADWVLFARLRGFAAAESKPVDLTATSVQSVTLHLVPQCVLRGHVLDADGQPIPDQAIYLGGYTTLRGGDWKTTSKADGTFELDSLPAAPLNLTTRHGSESVELKIADLKPGETRAGLVLRFGRKVAIQGRVTKSGGQPVGKLRVLVTRLEGAQSYGEAYTDAKGAFRIENVVPGRVRLSLHLGGGRRQHLTEPFEAPQSGIEITYDPPRKATLKGEILGPDGKPLELCSVSARSRGGEQQRSREIHGGRVELEVEGEAPFSIAVSRPRLSDGTPINVRGGGTTIADPRVAFTIRLEAGETVSGRVLDDKDKGVPNVVVRASDGSRAQSDRKGAWRLIGLRKGRLALSVEPPAGFIRPGSTVADTGAEDVVIHLTRGSPIRGHVLLPEGARLLGGQVMATWIAQGSHAAGRARGTLKAARTFLVQGMPSDVRVSLEIRPYNTEEQAVPLAPAIVENVIAGTLDLEVTLHAGVAVSGIVVNEDGSPFSKGTISLLGNGRGWSLIADDGTFRAEGLRPGAFDLHVFDGQGPVTAAQKVTAPSTNVRVVVPETGAISGTLRGAPSGTKWVIHAVDPETGEQPGRQVQAVAAPDGAWTLAPLPKGRAWIITAQQQDGASDQYARSGPLKAGTQGVRLTLERGASIRGSTTQGGRALPRCWVRAQAPGWQAHGTSDENGVFELRGLPPGSYTVNAGLWSLGVQGTRADIKTGSSDVVIDLDSDR